MKKDFFRVLLLAFAYSLPFISCSDDKEPPADETEIQVTDLPEAAQKFLKNFFYDETVSKIEKIQYSDMYIYSVTAGEYQIEFNEAGEWQQVDASTGISLPSGILPEPVETTLQERYPGFGVNQITRQGENYVVVLTNNQGQDSIRLTFNQSGEIIDSSMTPV